MSGSRLHQIGWLALLAVCCGLFLALSFRVHAVKSEVLLSEREIIALERETMMLEIEFEARANQRQLVEWNEVEFGYQAPRADQFIDSELQLASLSAPRQPGAPSPIRVAYADAATNTPTAADQRPMVSPVSGRPVTLAANDLLGTNESVAEAFGEFLSEASPVRSANARTLLNAEAAE